MHAFKKLGTLFALTGILCALLIQCAFAEPEQAYISGDVIVAFKAPGSTLKLKAGSGSNGIYTDYLESIATSVGASVAETYGELSGTASSIKNGDTDSKILARLSVPAGSERDVIDSLKAKNEVIGAQLNYRYSISDVTPSDTKYSSLWGMPAIKAPAAWGIETGSENVYVAVIDSGIDYTHADIKDNFETSGYSGNYSSGTESGDYSDGNGHGTHVAGTIGAVGNNGLGVVGVNWKTKLISLRIFNASGGCSTDEILKALAALLKLLNDNPTLKIASVNMSYGRSYPTTETPESYLNTPEYLAYKALSDTNRIVLCVAAGNDGIEIGNGQYTYPASFISLDNMIVVANAQNTEGYTRSSSSNYSTKFVDVAAPGSNILSTAPQSSTLNDYYPGKVETENGYKYLTISGTSMATPHVAGSVALLASAFPALDAPALKAAILKGANVSFSKTYTVNGFLDVNKSLEILEEEYGKGVPPTITSTALMKGYIAESYDAILTARGERPITWTKTSGTIPPGLTLSADRLTGTPTSGGNYTFTVKATNKNGSDTKSISVTISNGEPEILTDTLPDGSVSSAYSATLSAKGLKPMTWSLSSGTMPPGITISSDGTVTGACAKSGTWSFNVKAQNSAGSSTKKITLKIAGTYPYFYNSAYLPAATVGRAYSKQLFSTGTGPVTWTVSSGTLPPGLTLNASTGVISGTPTKASTSRYSFVIQAANDAGSNTKWFYIWVDDPATSSDIKILTDQLEPHVLYNVPYNIQLEASGTLPITWTLEEGSLPSGLSLDKDGVISGKSTLYSYGYNYIKVKATNSKGSVSKHILLNYDNNYEKIASETLPQAINGTNYYQRIYMTYSYNASLYSGELPPGILLTSGGYLSGTPTSTGTYTFTVIAGRTDYELFDKKTFTLTVRSSALKPTITTASLPDGILGARYSNVIGYSGTPASSINLTGSLPSGLSKSGNWITGTPTKTGEYNLSITITNSAGSDTKSFTLKIGDVPVRPSITTTSLANGAVGVSYDVILGATGTSPITWSIHSGQLPTGLTLSSTEGRITGAPKTAGSFDFTLKASNAGGYNVRAFTIGIKATSPNDPVLPAITTSPALSPATVGKAYSVTFQASGSKPITWKKSGGTLPKGLTLTNTGTLSGTPTTAKTYSFTLTATNTAGSASRTFTVSVFKAPSISTKSLAEGVVGEEYSFDLTASGTAPITWSVSGLPAGMSCTSGGHIGGTPSKSGSFDLFIEAFNSADATAQKHLTLTVKPAVLINETNFPDENFRTYVKTFDANKDDKLSTSELSNVTGIYVSGKKIASLKGIEFFTNITTLNCSTNQLETLDLTQNTNLNTLQCYNNQLTSLSLTKNTALTTLNCSNNKLEKLSLTKNTALITLQCYSNQIASLNITKNTALTSLNCDSNKLEALDLTKNTALVSLSCSYNQLKALSLTKNVALRSITCSGNQLETIDVTKNTALTYLNCSDNQLSALNVTKNAALTTLYCQNNKLKTLNVTKNLALDSLSCSSNQLSTLNVTKNTALTYLDCSYNQLTTLSLTKNRALHSLYVSYNQLTALDLSKNNAITYTYTYGQTSNNLRLTKQASGLYAANLGDYVPDTSKVSNVTGSYTPTYNAKTGKATFESVPSYVSYRYDTKLPNSSYSSYRYISIRLNVPDKPVIVTAYPPETQTGEFYSLQLEATGNKPLSWDITSKDIPAGLSFDSSGLLSGTPVNAGSFDFTVTAQNSEGRDSKKLTLSVKAVAPTIKTDATLPVGIKGKQYSLTLSADGTQPMTWTKSSGTLPSGLSLNKKTGVLSGKPTKLGTFTFKLKATNAGGSKTRTFTAKIVSALSISGEFRDGSLKENFTSSVSVTGGTAPYTWKKSSGTIPTGLTLSPSEDGKTITLSGTPSKTGTFTFKLKATDSDGTSLTKSFTVIITKPTINGTTSGGTVGQALTITFTASGGIAPYKWTKSSGSYPSGMKLTYSGDGLTAKLSGTPTKAAKFTFKLKLTDSTGSYSTKSFSVTIAAASSSKTKFEDVLSLPDVTTAPEESEEILTDESVPELLVNDTVTDEDTGISTFRTGLSVASSDVVSSYSGRDSDLVTVRTSEPVTFIIGDWGREVSDVTVYVDDEPVSVSISDDGTFTLPAEMIHDDFKVSVRARAGDSELESEELYLSAE